MSGYPQAAAPVLQRGGRRRSLGPMTNHPYSYDPDDTLDEAYMRWLDNNGFPSMRKLLGDEGGEDVAVLRSVPTRDALGVFHAVSTRDGEARARDGQAFYALNPLDSQADEAIMEVQFGDGFWMLAHPIDLHIAPSRF